MAFKNAEGKSFSSKFRMNRHAAAHGEGAPHKGNSVESPEAPDARENDVESGGTPAAEVAKEHGRAKEVNIKHDHEAGKHSVSSKHEDGHQHNSEHGSAEEAHKAGAQLAGVQVPGEEASAPGSDEGDSFQVPGLD